jgi:hypothetical protein
MRHGEFEAPDEVQITKDKDDSIRMVINRRESAALQRDAHVEHQGFRGRPFSTPFLKTGSTG